MKNEIITNENKGFSLVELIVVIAIMAVMTSVLAPSLLGYVEQSRMAKDDSAMGEVNNAIKLALADQNVYDECLIYNVKGNFSCYVDGDTTTNINGNKVEDKNVAPGTKGTIDATDYWHYNDNTRLKDETLYVAAGNMRGMTLTFAPDAASANEATFKMADARVNQMTRSTASIKVGRGEAASRSNTPLTLENMQTTAAKKGMLYNKLRAVIGDSIVLSSQTYRNSEYTVFIRMGSMGGNQADAQDAVAVYGQWNGTNLYADLYTTGGGTGGGTGG